jgi:hypothetical protein
MAVLSEAPSVGNDQEIPFLSVSGYDAWELISEQRLSRDGNSQRIFPYNSRSIGAADQVRRGCTVNTFAEASLAMIVPASKSNALSLPLTGSKRSEFVPLPFK